MAPPKQYRKKIQASYALINVADMIWWVKHCCWEETASTCMVQVHVLHVNKMYKHCITVSYTCTLLTSL